MTLFKKHNKPGSMFIEVMFAFTLLTIFGTSLFMIQSATFSKTFITHAKIIALQQINVLQVEFELEQQKQKNSNEPQQKVISQQSVKTPLEYLTIESKDISEESSLYKSFGKNVRMIQQVAYFDNIKEIFISFDFISPQQDSKESK